MERCFLGVDVGASKTHALIADEGGETIGFGVGGGGNPESVGYDGLRQALNAAVSQALAAPGIAREAIAGAGFGVAGYDWPSQRQPMLGAIDALGLQAPVGLVNDALLAVLAGAEEGWGIGVVAGTSCNAWGRDQAGRTGRMTGFSWLGEEAGGGELVMEALRAVARQWTRRGPPTRLTEAFVEFTGCEDAADFLEGLTRGRLQLGAELAPIVFCAAAEGDLVARELVLWAGRGLGNMAVGVVRQLGFQETAFDVVMAGSFFEGSPLLMEGMRAEIQPVAPGARLVRLGVPPVVGGVLLGMEEAMVELAPVRERLIASTNELLNRQDATA
jgi:N-acetylglucosamine kinase-like BadF-type ATPase